jgi:DNA ligase (NAD+)
MNATHLEDLIIQSSQRYYNGQNLLITDEQFDAAVEQLRLIKPNSWVLKTPNWGAVEDGTKIRHLGKNPVGSLNKIKYPEVAKNGLGYYASLKLDGLSVVTNSHNGQITAATRNDGVVGKICTDKILKILELTSPLALNFLRSYQGTFSVRGEVITRSSEIPRLKAEHAAQGKVFSPRNYAAGLMNRDEINEELGNLGFYVYFNRINTNYRFVKYTDMMSYLQDGGFYCVPFLFVQEGEPELLKKIFTGFQEEYPTDGLVLRDADVIDGASDLTDYELRSVAYKFPSEVVQAIVGEVNWATGSTGRVNPVIKLATPVELAGAMIQHATAFHAQFVRENKLGKGATIELTRSGEVIPYIKSVVTGTEAEIPTKCTSCESDLHEDGVYITCKNEECPARVISAIFRIIDVAGTPKGLSGKTVEKWAGDVQNVKEFIQLFKDGRSEIKDRKFHLTEMFGDHFGDLLYTLELNISSLLKKGLSFEQLWFVAGFNGLSNSHAAKLAAVDPREVLNGKDTEFKEIAHSNVQESVLSETGKERLKMNLECFNVIQVEVKKKEVKLIISVTGSVKIPRGEWSKKMESYGIEVGSVSKKTKYLVSNEPSTSAKSMAAIAKGVTVINELDFYSVLSKEYGINVDL